MRVSVLLAACVAVVVGCGGQVSGNPDAGDDGHASASGGSGSGSGGGSASGGSGGGSGGPIPLCPTDPPTVGVGCASPGQGCAYLIGGQCEGYRCTSESGWKMDPTVTCP
ncbi:MAG TPA: hypothetical protein VF765_22240 [Polyangiaceae bacterium]